MNKWIEAARLRTLPLSLAGIVTGFALSKGFDNYWLFILCCLTAISLQILSNFANDYGDFSKGTDNDNRVGPARTMQQGLITKKQMQAALVIFSVLSFGLGIITSLLAFNISIASLLFVLLGGACVVAAIMYTVGKNAYGYLGLGDVFVFVFFGLVSVLGTAYVVNQAFEFIYLVPACAIGLLSAAVLNLNNMRDIENDAVQGKRTIVTKMGLAKSLVYHKLIMILSISLIISYAILSLSNPLYSFLSVLAVFLFIAHLIRLQKKGVFTDFDPELKRVALPTFLFSILFLIQEILK